MEAFWISAVVVGLAEFGDKTQLAALVLAARYREPVPIILGLAAATLANHALAGLIGAGIAAALGPARLRLVLGVSFLAIAAWTLLPERSRDEPARAPRFGVWGTSALTFFLLEMGDKTQIATVALAARYQSLAPVIAGTTVGMLIADVPAVFLGRIAARWLPLRLLRALAAGILAALGALALLA